MRTLMRTFAKTIMLTLALGVAACELEAPPADAVEVEVGVHLVAFEVPRGWHHVDHGREQRFELETARISLADLGPMTAPGFAEIIRRARQLFRQNQWDDARTLLDTIDPRRFFSSELRWKSVRDDWNQITRIRRDEGAGESRGVSADVEWEVEGAFTQLLAEVSALRDPDLETVAMRAIHEIGHDEMRSIARTEALAVSGQPAIRIDTWDRLSHRGRRQHLFIANAGHLLVLRTEMGAAADLVAGFDELAASLALAQAQDSGSGA
jgi:hypothetical protein